MTRPAARPSFREIDLAEPPPLPPRSRPPEQRPIGVFGTGAGGMCVAEAIVATLPAESVLCLCDLAHYPYGPRSVSEVRRLTLQAMDWLVAAGVKAAVIACNTASSVAMHDVRERYRVPVLNLITPTVRAAGLVSGSRRIGLVATARTLAAGTFEDKFATMPEAELRSVVGPRLEAVTVVGSATRRHADVIAVAKTVTGLVTAGCDTVMLGCSRYSLLAQDVSRLLGEDVALVSGVAEVVDELAELLERAKLRRSPVSEAPRRDFVATASPEAVRGMWRELTGGDVRCPLPVS